MVLAAEATRGLLGPWRAGSSFGGGALEGRDSSRILLRSGDTLRTRSSVSGEEGWKVWRGVKGVRRFPWRKMGG